MKPPRLIVLFLLLFSTSAWAQSPKPASITELAIYTGADREQLLYAGAKSEGTVTWYTSLAGDSYKAMARAFEAKYPGVRVESYRTGGSELVVRMAEESKARRPTFDALETTYDYMMVSRANNFTRPYNSPVLANYPSEAKEKADKGLTFWTIFRESYMGFGYNKEQIPAGAVPKGFDGLLHPQLKGKMGITLNESSARMIGAILKIKGEELVKKLRAQEIRTYTVSSAALVDLIASGELGASFHIYRNHATVSAERGLRWAGCRWSWFRQTAAVSHSPLNRHTRMAPLFSSTSYSARRVAGCWKNTNMAIPRRNGRSSAGIRALAGRWNNLKQTVPSGRN